MPPVTEEATARRHVVAAVAVIVVTFGSVGAKRLSARLAERPSAEQCQQLVDRYLEHVLWQRDGAQKPEELTAALARARATEEHGLDAADCGRRLTREQVECGIAAPSVDELERCLQ